MITWSWGQTQSDCYTLWVIFFGDKIVLNQMVFVCGCTTLNILKIIGVDGTVICGCFFTVAVNIERSDISSGVGSHLPPYQRQGLLLLTAAYARLAGPLTSQQKGWDCRHMLQHPAELRPSRLHSTLSRANSPALHCTILMSDVNIM